MFEDIVKPNLVTLLALGVASALLPKLLPEMRPAMGTAIKLVLDLVTESEAEAAEEVMQGLVSATIAEINRRLGETATPDHSRKAVEHAMTRFKQRAQRRAHRWGANEHDRQRRYRRHLAKLRVAVDHSKEQHDGWRRDILDDLGESLDEAV